ncbi:MAG: Phosphatidylinositol mannoside acyltransferase [Cyanobacteria bacterium RYN_339]|nr:Phosphatidylinositol mannoside acyltransferase [Cyanobacteria bacterium RYN_339]
MTLQAWIYRLFLVLSWGLRALPRGLVLRMADGFAACAWAAYRLTPHREFIAGNVRAAGLPTDVAYLSVRNLARGIAEILRFPELGPIRYEGWDNVEAAQAEGQGIIIATMHFGNWELLGGALAARGLPLHVLVQPPSQDAFGRLFLEFRRKVGVTTHANSGAASLRPVLRALARNEALGLLADQHGEAQDAIVTLFDHPVSAPTGPVFFARRTGAAILPTFIVRQPDHSHVVHVLPRLVPSGDAQADMQQLYATYETFIRANPDHWLWVHDRWAREHELRPVRTLVAV